MLERLPRLWRNLALGALAALALAFAWSIRSVVNPLLLGYLLAYILHPAVLRVEQLGLSRRFAVNLIFVVGFAGALGVLWGLFLQARELVRDVLADEEVRAQIGRSFERLRSRLEERFGEGVVPAREDLPDLGAVIEWIREFVAEHQEAAQTAGQVTVEAAGNVFHALGFVLAAVVALGGLFVLVPLYTWYLLFELGRIHGWFRRYTPRGERDRVARIASQIGEVLANFFRGRLLVCFLKGLVIAAGLWLADMPYAFLFGMTGGFLSIVPFVGPMVAFAFAFVVGVLDHGVLGSLVRAGVVFGIAEVLEGYVFIPKVMGDTLGLHPVVVLFAILAGGAALGMFGILISLPVAATVVILFRELVQPALRAWAEGEG